MTTPAYFNEVQEALTSDAGRAAVLDLLSLFERRDIPVNRILLSVKVPPVAERERIGTVYGNVDLEVTT